MRCAAGVKYENALSDEELLRGAVLAALRKAEEAVNALRITDYSSLEFVLLDS